MTNATIHFVCGCVAGVAFGAAGGMVIAGFWRWSLVAVVIGLLAAGLSWWVAWEDQ